jgi:hypothetical protein
MQPVVKSVFGIPSSKPRLQALCYLLVHPVAVVLLFLAAQFFYTNKHMHAGFLILCITSAVYRAACYYQYAFGQKITKALKAALEKEVKSD